MNTIKPIETVYKGYRFRSRLEARWAVFFDSMGMEWEYEKEGFDLSGKKYLPDFWLPKFDTWAEIKPTDFSKEEFELCELLVTGTGKSCLLLVGAPDYREYELLEPTYESEPNLNPTSWKDEYKIKEPREINGAYKTKVALISDWFDEDRFGYQMYYEKAEQYGDDYREAVLNARQARFEHGESPYIQSRG